MKILSGRDIKQLMRANCSTIRDIALRMNTSFDRVKHARKHGVTGKCACQDWFEAITQTGVFAPTTLAPVTNKTAASTGFSIPHFHQYASTTGRAQHMDSNHAQVLH